jgi:hypothetical protein
MTSKRNLSSTMGGGFAKLKDLAPPPAPRDIRKGRKSAQVDLDKESATIKPLEFQKVVDRDSIQNNMYSKCKLAVSDLTARLGELGMDELANIGQDKGSA